MGESAGQGKSKDVAINNAFDVEYKSIDLNMVSVM